MVPVSSLFFAPRKKAKKVEGAVATATQEQPTEEPTEKTPSPLVPPAPTKVFVDLDGVLVDFDQGVQSLTGKSPDALSSGQLWSAIAKADHFYRHLPWTRDGEQLWEALRVLRPSILTGVPSAHAHHHALDKYAWCQRELCVETVHWSKAGPKKSHAAIAKQEKRRGAKVWCKVITCWSRNKHLESGPGRVLIDDRQDLRGDWEARGGIFIHHVNTEQTLRLLRQKNILPLQTPLPQPADEDSTEHEPTTDFVLEQQEAAQTCTERQTLLASEN